MPGWPDRSLGSTSFRAWVAVLALIGFLIGPAQTADAQSPVDLLTDANLRIDGASAGDQAAEVAEAGDVNGDGRSDVIVGGVFANAAHVVFGRAEMGTVDLGDLGSGGFSDRPCRAWQWAGRLRRWGR